MAEDQAVVVRVLLGSHRTLSHDMVLQHIRMRVLAVLHRADRVLMDLMQQVSALQHILYRTRSTPQARATIKADHTDHIALHIIALDRQDIPRTDRTRLIIQGRIARVAIRTTRDPDQVEEAR